MRKFFRRALYLILALGMLISAVPAYAAQTQFPDVKPGAWYEEYMNKVTGLPGIINGIRDKDDVLRFYPDNPVKRGEFLKMVVKAAQLIVSVYTNDRSLNQIHWAGEYYTIAMDEKLLVPDAFASGSGVQILFECTWAELEKPISRYEMAVILNNICTNTLMEKPVIATDAESHIADYSQISTYRTAATGARYSYATAVEQAYGKGILTGFDDTSFRGDETLTRAQAVAVIERLLWDGDRKMPDWAEEQPREVIIESSRPAIFAATSTSQSFAEWLNSGHVNGYGRVDTEAAILLFGDPNKQYFSSATEAAPFMKVITVPIWTLDKMGNKIPSTATMSVHCLVAQEVQLIFQQIYDDPEQFPIFGGWSVGAARFSDTMRHSWGCAIDINPYYNCECDFKGPGGSLRVTCGYGWWPIGHNDLTYVGSLTGQSVYSIGSNPNEYGYSVVKAFKDYGWGWGGQGYSSGKHDFMHFSVMKSGG